MTKAQDEAAQTQVVAEEPAVAVDDAVEENEPVNFDWKKLTPHKFAEGFPLMEGEEFEAFCDDAQESGIINQIWYYKDPNDQKLYYLDGWTRIRAAKARNIALYKKDFKEFVGTEEQAKTFPFPLLLDLEIKGLGRGSYELSILMPPAGAIPKMEIAKTG